MGIKLVIIALITVLSTARKCGITRIATYADDNCKTYKDVIYRPVEECSTTYIDSKQDLLTIATYCSDTGMTYAWYP